MPLFNIVPCVRKPGFNVWRGQTDPVLVRHFDTADQAETWIHDQAGWRRR